MFQVELSRPFCVPGPVATCPGCGSVRVFDQGYCRNCLTEIQSLWPDVLAQELPEGAAPLVDEGALVL